MLGKETKQLFWESSRREKEKMGKLRVRRRDSGGRLAREKGVGEEREKKMKVKKRRGERMKRKQLQWPWIFEALLWFLDD